VLENELKMGDTGDSVKILQEKLKLLGFYNALVMGSFGLSTEVGVKAFQNEFGLEATGIVNNEMWDILMGVTETTPLALSNYPTLSLGSKGEYVKELQTKLKALLYYTGKINSNFDLETESAVKRLQFNNDITTTGVVNSQTWNLIEMLYGSLNECVTGSTSNDYIKYTVVRGDTLYGIARKYGTTVDEIKELNNLASNTLSIGQVLKIPTTSDNNYIKYTVIRGDTLYGIAKKYGTTVDEIKRLNNLASNTLSIGQILKIPTTNNNNYIDYTVVRGDTLYGIARKYGTTVDEIKRLNNLTSNTLSIGQVLKIKV